MEIRNLSYDDYVNTEKGPENNFDIGANLMSNYSIASYSPVVLSTRFCIVVPYERLMEQCEFIRHVFFNWTVCGIWIFSCITIAVIKRLVNPKMTLTTVFYRSLQLSMGATTTSRIFRNLRFPDKFVVIGTLIYNILITCVMCGALTMAFTAGLRKPDIVDIDSFLDSNLRIMVRRKLILDIIESNQMEGALIDRLLFVDDEIRNKHLHSLNDSYAYIVNEHQWLEISYIQQRLLKPKLKLAPESLCSVYFHLRIAINPHQQYTLALRSFVDQCRETGFIDIWMRMGIRQAEQAGLINKAPYEPPLQLPLTLRFFKLLFKLYGIGMLLSLGALISELIFMHCLSRCNENVITV